MTAKNLFLPQPVISRMSLALFGGAVRFFAFGRPHNYARLWDNTEAVEIIARIAKPLGVKHVFAPVVKNANARLIEGKPELFSRTDVWNGIHFHFGPEVDGVELLEPGSAFFVASADCPTFVAQLPNRVVIAAHAALNSLIDRKNMDDPDIPPRQHESVVMAALQDFDCEWNAGTRAALLCGISSAHYSHSWDDTDHGGSNRRMVEYLISHYGSTTVNGFSGDGRIDIRALVYSQLKKLGVPVDDHGVFETDKVCTFSDTENGERVWHSHRWSCQQKDSDEGRNGILVVYMG